MGRSFIQTMPSIQDLLTFKFISWQQKAWQSEANTSRTKRFGWQSLANL